MLSETSSTGLTTLAAVDFAERLAAREPVPGGGGAAALVGALGAALASMVANYTVGKPRYAAVEADVRLALAQAERIRHWLLVLVDEDARAYGLVSAAYALPREDPARTDAVEAALHEAALPPYRTMVSCARALMALEELGQKGSRMLLSDVACGAHLCRAAMEASSVNVYVNTASMRDRVRAAELERECDALLAEWVPRARELSAAMTAKVRRES